MLRKLQHQLILLGSSILVCALPFWKVLLFEDRILLYRDIARHFLPGKVYWARSVLNDGAIPLWNFSATGGMPFWAENVNSPLHPFNILFLLFPLGKAPLVMNWFIFLHYPILLLGGFYLLRTLEWKRGEAFVFASALSLSGTFISSHNLCHSLFSFVAVPWFFGFWISFLRSRKSFFLFASATAISWPIYAGDPQFSYFLAIGAALLALYQGLFIKNLRAFFSLGVLAILCAGAQLFPLIEMIFHSKRNSLSRSELLYFSFHPIRLIETIFPQFFGNHDGALSFWGQTYVNFPFPSPFVFSTYPGSLIVIFGSLGIISSIPTKYKDLLLSRTLITSCFLLFLFLSFGSLSPLPLYEFFMDTFPLFQSFRYPERLLFWVFFLFWMVACLKYQSLKEKFIRDRNIALAKGFFPFGVLLIAYGALGGILSWLRLAPQLPTATWLGICVFPLMLGLSFLVVRNSRWIWLLFFFVLAEGLWIQSQLSWDSSIYITDSRRYSVMQEILQDLKARESELAKGAPRRYSSMEVRPIRLNSNALTHTNLSNFSAFESANPNIPSFYGIDDIGGYFALAPKRYEEFLLNIVGEVRDELKIQRFFDLTGTYYRAQRDKEEHLVLEKRPTAIPYLFAPMAIIGKLSREEVLGKILTIAPAKEVVLYPLADDFSQSGETLVENLKRTGNTLSAEVISKEARPWIVWNEGYHSSWQAWAEGQRLEIKEANGFSMATQLPAVSASNEGNYHWQITFRFVSPWIRLGVAATTLFFLLFLFFYLAALRKPLQSSGFF